MEAVFADFVRAHSFPDGNLLATTISPEAPASDPARLYNFHRSSNAHSITTDLRYKLQYNSGLQHLDRKETTAWVDVFVAYYNFIGTLLAAEEAQNASYSKDADWLAVYEGWKDVSSTLQKGYSNAGFAAWTIPCLYTAAKYLRIFAIKADTKIASQRDSGMAFGGVQDDEVFDDSSKNEKLEDAARMINRIFALCLGDRYVATTIPVSPVNDDCFPYVSPHTALYLSLCANAHR
nr:protein csn12 like [Quercus suber]